MRRATRATADRSGVAVAASMPWVKADMTAEPTPVIEQSTAINVWPPLAWGTRTHRSPASPAQVTLAKPNSKLREAVAPSGIIVFTHAPGVLSHEVFVNLLDMGTQWSRSKTEPGVFEGRCRVKGDVRWTATIADLVFGSNSQLRALAEVYAGSDGQPKFVRDFVRAWTKVMEADRFDLA